MTALPTAGNILPLLPVKPMPIRDNLAYQVQNPRFVVKIDGNPYLATSFTYTSNAHGATDTASVKMPIDGAANFPDFAQSSLYPDWTRSIERTSQLGNANQPVLIELWSGQPTDPGSFGPNNLSGLSLRFRGCVDLYTVKLEGNETTFSCRSLAFPMLTRKITIPFARENTMTTVQFLQQQAARFGLTVAPPLLAQPPFLMIDVLGDEFISGVHNFYIWALLLKCAMADGVDIWVDRNGVIHYAAASLVQRKPIYYNWNQNCKGLEGTHSPQFSKDVRVQVHSWTARTRTASVHRVSTGPDGSRQESSYTRTSVVAPIFGTTESLVTTYGKDGSVSTSMGSSSGGGASGGTGIESEGQETYLFYPKNKTLAQCQLLAQQDWLEISQHEYSIKLTAPVTPQDMEVMDVTAALFVANTPMARFNSEYWPRQIVETLDPKQGWFWTIDALNHQLPSGEI